MDFELFLLKWVVGTLVFALLMGGIPWQFPKHSQVLKEQWDVRIFSSRNDFKRSRARSGKGRFQIPPPIDKDFHIRKF